MEKHVKERMDKLNGLGLKFNGEYFMLDDQEMYHHTDILCDSDEQFDFFYDKLIEKMKADTPKVNIDDFKVYYAKSENPEHKGKKKFLYLEISGESVNLFKETRTTVYGCGTHDQVHMTTDGAFEKYIEKRKCIPKMVHLMNTQKELDSVLETVGIVL